ncbi:outer membrane beta-barrel protein [Thioalkalivibrio sp. XN8]|uniref:outer membrane beta-barrel protein n=1 Tax=Thioalkalivibrio sp. XN8 TaxID=2712863 RepID=UPI0013EAD942|nr:outer membrane beta-barrel protein [Thioalkalivibrio sp. XN8]NGP52022.1 outer membrane beta-barrel protein [Thioalkalivibrio sp. XN8]
MSQQAPKSISWMVAAALVVAAPAATAAESRLEVGAFGAWRLGGEFTAGADTPAEREVDLEESGSWGLSLGLYRDPDSFYEFLYSRQSTRLDRGDFGPGAPGISAEYYHVGGTLLFGDEPRYRSFVSLTIGAGRFKADGFGAETDLSVSLGTGLRVPVTERLAIDFGVRGYLTFIDQDTRLFCTSIGGQGGCLLESSGSSVFQAEASAGFRWRF